VDAKHSSGGIKSFDYAHPSTTLTLRLRSPFDYAQGEEFFMPSGDEARAETRHSNFILGNRIQKYTIICFTKKVEYVKCGLDTDF
jgi:hypothetical protein